MQDLFLNLVLAKRSSMFFARLLLCAGLMALSVAFGVYAFFGGLSIFYLIHFGNAITAIFMNRDAATPLRWLYPLASLAAYAGVRCLSQTWEHIAAAGGINVIEICAIHCIMQRCLSFDARMHCSIRFLNVVFGISLGVSFVFALCGTGLLAWTDAPLDYSTVLWLYWCGHVAGAFMVLHTYYVQKGYGRRWPPRSYVIELCTVLVIATVVNSFLEYGILQDAAIIICFPLMAWIAARHDPGWSSVAYILLILLIFVEVGLRRGPFYESGSDILRTVTSLYVLLASLAVMMAYLSLFLEQRRQALAENDRVLHEVLQLKDEIVFISSQVSHDIRGPVSHLLAVSTALVDGELDAVEKGDVQYSCETIVDLMDSWLITLNKSGTDVSPGGALLDSRISVVDTHAYLQRLLKAVQRAIVSSGKQLTIEYTLPVVPEDKQLAFNSKLLQHVLTNLLSNAVKYSNTGVIKLHMKLLSETQLQVSVADEGMGIRAEHLDHIFERFYRVEEEHAQVNTSKSHGVGLHIVKTLVESMQGTMHVTSEFGRGTEFCVQVRVRVRVRVRQLRVSQCKLTDFVESHCEACVGK
jgi:signal transduction histidine kinase